MEYNNMTPEQYKLLACLGTLPEKIMSLHGTQNATEFILHTLCTAAHINPDKIAYFVDNPDFDFCKGVTGISYDEQFNEDIWDKPQQFTDHMQKSPFNQKVRNTMFESYSLKNDTDRVAYKLTHDLGLNNPKHYVSKVRNDNVGFLIIDAEASGTEGDVDVYLVNALCLLGMCPIF